MPYIKTNGTELYYEICGRGEPVVFIHGIGVTSKIWDFQKKDMSQRYMMITYDLRGSGKSLKTPEIHHTVELLADDLKGLIDNMGLNRVNIVGLSFGAAVAMKFSMKYKENVHRLVLTGAFVDKGGIVGGAGRCFPNILVKLIMNKYAGELAEKLMLPSAPKEELLYYHKNIVSINKDEIKKYCQLLKSYSFTPALEKVNCPTLILCGEHERAFHPYARYINKKVKGSKFEIIPGVGHGWNGEKPELFSRKIIEFLG